MSAKHTPRPWNKFPVYQNDNGDWVVLILRAGGGAPFVAKAGGRTQEETEANGHLIAASPELLAALVEAEEYLTKFVNPCEADGAFEPLMRARAAIAKATNTLTP